MISSKDEPKTNLSDVDDYEWAFVVPYLTLMRKRACSGTTTLQGISNGLQYLVQSVAAWPMIPNALPLCHGILANATLVGGWQV